MKKRFFYNHPIIGGLIAMALVMAISFIIGGIAQFGVAFVDVRSAAQAGEIANPGDIRGTLQVVKEFLDNDLERAVYQGTVALTALLCLLIFTWKNKKNGYLGPFKIRGEKLKDVTIYIAIFVILDIVATLVELFTYPGGFPKISITYGMVVMALYAGFNEEISDRAIPAAIMMRNKPGKGRILVTVLLTSLLFGAGHIINLLSGRELLMTIIQIVSATGAGLFFVAIYLRTGSIAISIIIHAFHDFTIFMTSSLPEVGSPLMINTVFSLLTNVLPFVFGILMLLPMFYPGIISTWKRIWSENENVIE